MGSSLSVVIPVYEAEATLPTLIPALHHALRALGLPFEIILVDDASPDNSWNQMEEIRQTYCEVSIMRLPQNVGQMNALMTGIRSAQNEITVTMDDDWAHPPSAIPSLVTKINEGFDLVYGMPQKHPRQLVRSVVCALARASINQKLGTRGLGSPFRAFKTELVRSSKERFLPNTPLETFLLPHRSRIRVSWVPVMFGPSRKVRSHHSWSRQTMNFLDYATTVGILPSAIFTVVALALLGAGGVSFALRSSLAGAVFSMFAVLIFVVNYFGTYVATLRRRYAALWAQGFKSLL